MTSTQVTSSEPATRYEYKNPYHEDDHEDDLDDYDHHDDHPDDYHQQHKSTKQCVHFWSSVQWMCCDPRIQWTGSHYGHILDAMPVFVCL